MKMQWLVREGSTTDGNAGFVAKRLPVFPDKSKRKLLPVFVSVGWAFDDEGSNRLPTPEEWQRIEACENALAKAVSTLNAVLAGSLTCDGFHQFLVYCNDGTSIQVKLMDALPKPI